MNDEQKPDANIAAFGDAMHDTLMNLPESERYKKAKEAFLDDLWSDFEYSVIEYMGKQIEGFVRDMAGRIVTEILEGRDDQMRRYLQCDGYTGRDYKHDVHFNGTLFEPHAIELRKRVVEAHAELIRNERIADLESQVAGLTERIKERDRQIDAMRNHAPRY